MQKIFNALSGSWGGGGGGRGKKCITAYGTKMHLFALPITLLKNRFKYRMYGTLRVP